MRVAVKALVVALVVLVGGMSISTAAGSATVPEDNTSRPRWPGHQPDKIILGMSCGSLCVDKERELALEYGVHRQFTTWGDWRGLVQKIRADHENRRVPWVSVKGPEQGSPAGWRAVATGMYDDEIRRLAAHLAANDGLPIILTFHHEPSNDGTEMEGRDWAHANNRIRNVLKHSNALVNVAYAPIVDEWLFNPRNLSQDPDNWVRPGVLKRADFLGIDLYENDSGETFAQRLPRIVDWMAETGFPNKMIGIGEMGGTNARYASKSASQFINGSLRWATAHTGKIGVVSYFNSTANSRAGVHWPLNETRHKLATYRKWLARSTVATRVSGGSSYR